MADDPSGWAIDDVVPRRELHNRRCHICTARCSSTGPLPPLTLVSAVRCDGPDPGAPPVSGKRRMWSPPNADSCSPRDHLNAEALTSGASGSPPCRASPTRTWPTANTRSTLCRWPRPRSKAGTSPLTSGRATWRPCRTASPARALTHSADRPCTTRLTSGGHAGSGCPTASCARTGSRRPRHGRAACSRMPTAASSSTRRRN